jgi:predicted RNase H-like HicB family nuclease
MSEIIFDMYKDEIDGGYTASAVSGGIHTEGETLDELRRNVREAVDCYFGDPANAPKIRIR